MVIYTGHWKRGHIQLLNGSLLDPCQALARLVSHTVLAYFAKPPCSGCQHGAGKAIKGETAAAEVPELPQKMSCFLHPAGKDHSWASKAHLETPSRLLTCRGAASVFNRLVLEMKGKLHIYP